MANCCAMGCSGSSCATGMVTLEMFLDTPERFKPFLYSKEQINGLSKAGYKSYIENIKAYNSMCDLAEMPERKINEAEPWK